MKIQGRRVTHPRSHVLLLTAMLVSVLLIPSGAARAASVKEVEETIGRAKSYLYAQQNKKGTWEIEATPVRGDDGHDVRGAQWGGLTALVTLALLSAGDSPQDKRLAPAIEFLKKIKITGTYALGTRAQIWLLLPQTPEIKALAKKDAAALQALMSRAKGTPSFGFYDYEAGRTGNNYSLSRSQYAVLGMWAAAQVGVEVNTSYWETTERVWVDAQEKDGGWRYRVGGRTEYPVTPGITAVGVATLYITQEYLTAAGARNCKGSISNPSIERGLAWLGANFDKVATTERYPRDFPYATLYAMERVGVAGGRKYFGKVDWFQKGAEFLVEQQNKDGSFPSGGFTGRVPDVCFSLLFLSRGRAPVMLSKLEYALPDGKESDWNQRPRDVANLARWVGRSFERDLNWQIVSPAAPLEDLHEAPVLYVAGTKELKLDDAAKQKLKAFIQQGGLLLGNADCGGRAFANSFKRLGSELFPAHEFRELPAEHPIYNGVYSRSKWRAKPSVLGLSNGVRELMLLVPQGDPARAWQSQEVQGREEMWQLGANICFYVADRRNLRLRGETHLVARRAKVTSTGVVRVARLKYAGNWDPEPAGWARLANVVHNRSKLTLDVKTIEPAKESLDGPKIAHLTGTAAFKLDDKARAALAAFLKSGGTLVIDAAGGAGAFASSAEREIAVLVPDGKLEVLPQGHPVFASGDKVALDTFVYRRAARDSVVGKTKGPRLQGVTVGDRVAVFFSREDLSAGLVGQSVDGIIGYEPETATEIMRRIIAYASGDRPGADGATTAAAANDENPKGAAAR